MGFGIQDSGFSNHDMDMDMEMGVNERDIRVGILHTSILDLIF
jgi:hypothetical protein